MPKKIAWYMKKMRLSSLYAPLSATSGKYAGAPTPYPKRQA